MKEIKIEATKEHDFGVTVLELIFHTTTEDEALEQAKIIFGSNAILRVL